MFDDPYKNWAAMAIGNLRAELDELVKSQLASAKRLEAIEKRHAEHDAGLRAMATETKTAGGMFVRTADECSFCGSENVKNQYRGYGKNSVRCFDCAAMGPHVDSVEGAIAAWNRAKR